MRDDIEAVSCNKKWWWWIRIVGEGPLVMGNGLQRTCGSQMMMEIKFDQNEVMVVCGAHGKWSKASGWCLGRR